MYVQQFYTCGMKKSAVAGYKSTVSQSGGNIYLHIFSVKSPAAGGAFMLNNFYPVVQLSRNVADK